MQTLQQTQVKERPILFSAPMVLAILENRKVQTRRVVKPSQSNPKVSPLEMHPWIIDGEVQTDNNGSPCWVGTHPDYPTGEKWFSCPYGKVGDRLWVRETWFEYDLQPGLYYYRATDTGVLPAEYDQKLEKTPWKPSIYMPRAASRVTLEITDIRNERLQDISEEDAIAEGVPLFDWDDGKSLRPIHAFAKLWDSINGKTYPWDSNPWLWAVSFRKVEPA